MPKNAQTAAAKWAAGMRQSGDAARAGAQAMTTSPGQAAAARVDYWQQQVSSDGARQRYVQGNQAYTLADWQAEYLGKGVQRMTAAAAGAQPLVEQFMSQWLPYAQGIAAQVAAMPNNSTEDAVAKAAAQIRGNAAFKGRYTRRRRAMGS